MQAAEDVRTPAEICIERAWQYAADVRSGRRVENRYIKLAVERFYHDIETGHERGLHLDENAAARKFNFTARYCRHSKGKWKGKPLDLSPFQCFKELNIYGWLREDGTRRFRTVYDDMARKNGKTTELASAGLYGLVGDNEQGAEVYSAATKRDQSRLLFEEASRMVRQDPVLRGMLRVLDKSLTDLKSFSKFEPLAAESKSLDGLNVSTGLVDEFHAHPNASVWNVLKSASGSRAQPLHWVITTAGFQQSCICFEVRDYAIKVLEGVIQDDAFFGAIYTLDEDDDWQDKSVWHKANPNLGVSISMQYLEDQFRQAMATPSERANFMTKHLNIWVNAEFAHVDMLQFADCRPKDEHGKIQVYQLQDLKGLRCKAGLDAGITTDISSFVMLFMLPDGKKRYFGRHYLPEDTVKKRTEKSNVPYDQWARDGWLVLTPGNITDYNFIKQDILDFCELFDDIEIAYDRFNVSQLVNDLVAEGIQMVEYGQGYVSMNPALREMDRLYLTGGFEHNGDPVLLWCASNVVARKDPAGNIKPDKEKSKDMIDPYVALVMSAGLWLQDEGPGGTIYDTEKLLVLN